MKKAFLVLFFLSAGFLKTTFSQNCEPLPEMFVEEEIGKNRSYEFINAVPSKHEKLTAASNHLAISFIYSRAAIDALFNTINSEKGIRIYFAKYKPCNGSPLTGNVETGKLILLFAMEPNAGTPAMFYYLAENDATLYEVSPACAQDWTADYIQSCEPGLRETIDNTEDDIDAGSATGFSDTKSIWYKKDKVTQAFGDEEKYQNDIHKITITNYRVSFAAYDKKGKPFKPHYSKRLHLQFDYMYEKDGKKTLLQLEQQSDYECRVTNLLLQQNPRFDKNKLTKMSVKEKLAILKINNGLLCPTNCP